MKPGIMPSFFFLPETKQPVPFFQLRFLYLYQKVSISRTSIMDDMNNASPLAGFFAIRFF
jgi:hypothetical protein